MPRLALHLAVVACLVLAGCVTNVPTAAPTTTPSETTGSTETTLACQETDYDQRPLPDVPENVTAETAVEFAAAYENVTFWNENADKADNSLRVDTRASVVNETETGFVVHVSGGGSYVACIDSGEAVSDEWFRTNYFVNETMTARLVQPENKTDDPRENGGEVVEQR